MDTMSPDRKIRFVLWRFDIGIVCLVAVSSLCCQGFMGDEAEERVWAEEQNAVAYEAFACPAVPTAYVFTPEDPTVARGATWALKGAGFNVESLPLTSSPAELHGLIVFPSLASSDSTYTEYMTQYAVDLYAFVDGANVLLQLPQVAKTEVEPTFLPSTLTAWRDEAQVSAVVLTDATHPLLESLPKTPLAWRGPDDGVQVFMDYRGFEALLTEKADGHALLLEGALGRGRVLLSALALDAEYEDPQQTDFSRDLFENLLGYVQSVCSRNETDVALVSQGPSASFSEDSSVLAVLPDTQMYSLKTPGLFYAQTGWLRDHARRLDIRYVIQLGDIVNNNTPLEWEHAAYAMSLLDGKVPYVMVPGNHDYGIEGNGSTRDTLMNEYFSFESAASLPGFGGAYERDRLDNTYHLFSTQGRDFVLLALEWGPRDVVIEWANQVMEEYPEREGILATHAYLNNNDLRYDHNDTQHSQRFNPHEYATQGGVNDGEELWQKLVRRHRFSIVLSGHVLGDGTGYLESKTDTGTTCHQMLSNYQMREQGGEAYMRLLEFLPDGRTVRVFTYSPFYDNFLDEAHQNFTIELDPVSD